MLASLVKVRYRSAVAVESYTLSDSREGRLLRDALERSPARLDLAAIAIATIAYPAIDRIAIDQTLDGLAAKVIARSGAATDPADRVAALRGVLADEEGFRGDGDSYDAPESSFINRVLERRRGLPILLSTIYIEVGRRAGIALAGAAFPAHFLVTCQLGARTLVLDPFHGGQLLDEAACKGLLRRMAPEVNWSANLLAPATPAAIAFRMLTNLKRIYLGRGENDLALRVLALLLSIAPDHPGELRARASLLTTMGAHRAALADIRRCLELGPESPDRGVLEQSARVLSGKLRPMN